jgi:hypothetical protein
VLPLARIRTLIGIDVTRREDLFNIQLALEDLRRGAGAERTER